MLVREFDVITQGQRLRARHIRHQTSLEHYPTLVFLHDSLGCITLWRDFPARMAEVSGCNVLIYDRQGHGQSFPFTGKRALDYLEREAVVLPQVLEQCGIDSAILFGHSDGGSIALVAAAQNPNLICGVVSEAAHVFVDELTIRGVSQALEQYQTSNLKERVTRYHGIKTDVLFHAWTDTWLADWYQDWSIEHYLPHIQCPVLAIQGDQDEFGTVEQINRIVQQSGSQAEACMLPGVGHTPHKESPELIEEIVTTFIRKVTN